MEISINNKSPIRVDAKFNDGINVIYCYSGTGKTFLFTKLNDYYANNNMHRVSLINYNFYNKSVDAVIDFCKGSDLILLDNADLYISHDLINRLKSICNCIVVSMKNTLFFDKYEVSELSVEYNNHYIRTIQR